MREATVRYRLTRLYRRLDVRDRVAAVERARDLGLREVLTGLHDGLVVEGRTRDLERLGA